MRNGENIAKRIIEENAPIVKWTTARYAFPSNNNAWPGRDARE